MRVPINLASEPFSRNRSTIVTTVVLGSVLLLLAGLQGILILAARENAAENREQVARLNKQLSDISSEHSQINNTMREPVNAAMLAQSVLLNSLIERKAISWAQLLADIEGVLPNNVRVVQIRLPQVSTNNEVTLDLEIGAKNDSDAIEFYKRLAASSLFGPATPLRADPPTENDSSWRYRLTVRYGQKL